MILVTGANGFVGSHIVKLLVGRGERVRCLLRRTSNMLNLKAADIKDKIEVFYGDIRDIEAIKAVVRGADTVYHLAAYVHLWYADPKSVYEINWKGSKNLFEACLEEGVKKVVYTSTAAILKGGTKERPSDETAVLPLEKMPGHYARSKLRAYEEALKCIKEGLPIVTLALTTPIGAGDCNLTPPGKMIADYLNGRLPGYINTLINYIDVEDAAAGHLLAQEKGKIGERYIVGARNLTMQEALDILSSVSGRRRPRFKLPALPLLPVGYVSQKICELITHSEPRIPWEGLRLGRRPFAFDCSKAVRELGLPQSDIENAFRKAVDWFYDNGYAKRSSK